VLSTQSSSSPSTALAGVQLSLPAGPGQAMPVPAAHSATTCSGLTHTKAMKFKCCGLSLRLTRQVYEHTATASGMLLLS